MSTKDATFWIPLLLIKHVASTWIVSLLAQDSRSSVIAADRHVCFWSCRKTQISFHNSWTKRNCQKQCPNRFRITLDRPFVKTREMRLVKIFLFVIDDVTIVSLSKWSGLTALAKLQLTLRTSDRFSTCHVQDSLASSIHAKATLAALNLSSRFSSKMQNVSNFKLCNFNLCEKFLFSFSANVQLNVQCKIFAENVEETIDFELLIETKI